MGGEDIKMANIEKIERVAIKNLKPYKNNAKEHSKEQIESLKKSIKEFGFLNPIMIDQDGNVLAGHGRLMAAKSLHYKKVPCVFVEGLTEDEKKAYILADNKLSEMSTWNTDLLKTEIESLPKIDMSEFGFDLPALDIDFNNQTLIDNNDDTEPDDDSDDGPGYFGEAREKTYQMYHLYEYDEKRAASYFDFPTLEKTDHIPKSLESFNDILQYKDHDCGIHFFIDDYKFERLWRNLDKYLEIISRFDCMIQPDFSIYMDMPMAMKIWNFYRSRLVSQAAQDYGITVIPELPWMGPRNYKWMAEGMPVGGTYATSTVGLTDDDDIKEIFYKGLDESLAAVKPDTLLLYGSKIDYDFGNLNVIYYSSHKFRED